MAQSVALPRPIPSPPGLPLLGQRLAFRANLPGLLLRLSREQGDICFIRLGRRRILFLNRPEFIAPVLREHGDLVEKRAGGGSARTQVLGRGLLNSEGAFHHHQRKLVAPAFQPRHIAAYDRFIVDYATRAHHAWADGATIDLSEQMNRLALGSAGKALFDADLLDEADTLHTSLLTVRQYVKDQTNSRFHIPSHWPTPRNRRFQAALARLDATIARLIAERQATGGAGGDLLSLLLAAADEDGGMTARQVRDEAVNLFWAGHETTAMTLTWAWYLLAQHPAVYARLQAEVDHALAGRPPTSDDIPALSYAQQVFKETLRLYPPIFAFGRQTRQPLDVGGYTVPPGTAILISPYALHRRAAAFPDPERFDPDRFTAEEEARRPRLAYLPYGGGRWVCLGAHLAQLEGTLVLATLAQSVQFELVPGQSINPETILAGHAPERILVRVRGALKKHPDGLTTHH